MKKKNELYEVLYAKRQLQEREVGNKNDLESMPTDNAYESQLKEVIKANQDGKGHAQPTNFCEDAP